MTDDGRGAMAFSLSGANDFPSAAYVRIKDQKLSRVVRTATAGVAPLDDFSGYALFQGQEQTPSRFGDYSAALIDGSTLWMSTEAVTGTARDTFTNWGTGVGRIDLDDDVDP
jgi:hypothetical protein